MSAEHVRRWREANPERAREQARRDTARYRAAHPERAAASRAAWRSAHPDLVRENHRHYRQRNRARMAERQRQKLRRRAVRGLAARGPIWHCLDPWTRRTP